MWAIVLMNERVTREERLQSPGEEIANSVSAGAGPIAAIAGIPLLLAFALKRFGPRNEIVFSPTFSGSIAATGKKSM